MSNAEFGTTGGLRFIHWTHENPVLQDWEEMRLCVTIVSTVDGKG